MFRIAVCSSQTNDKNETSRTIQKWIKRNITADAELCQVESVEELQNIMETQPDKYNFCIMDMPALKSAFEAQTEQKKHPLLIHGTDSIRHIFVEDIMYAQAFMQPHKSFFVQLRYISELGTDHILMADGKKIPVAQSRLVTVQSRYLHYLTQRTKA